MCRITSGEMFRIKRVVYSVKIIIIYDLFVSHCRYVNTSRCVRNLYGYTHINIKQMVLGAFSKVHGPFNNIIMHRICTCTVFGEFICIIRLINILRTLSKAKGLRLRSDLSMLLGAGGLGRVNASLTLAPSVSGPAPSLFWTLVTRSFDLKYYYTQ